MKIRNVTHLAGMAAGATLGMASSAWAHTGATTTSGFASGFGHPIGGIDHTLAMVAVGVWAAQLAKNSARALWAVPMAFVGAMIAGGALAMAHVEMPFVEGGILASILVLGLLIATATKVPAWAGALVAGGFALFHGHAHGAEMPASASGAEYALGFVLATALLHAVGIAAGVGVSRALGARSVRASELPVRFAGAAVALAGLFLAVR